MSSNFKNVVDIDKWQKIQNHFSEVLRIALRTFDKDGTLITKPSMRFKLCDQVIKESSKVILPCSCKPKDLSRLEEDWKEGYLCFKGVHGFFIPLRMKQETLAYLVVGPVILGRRQEESGYRQTAKELGVNAEDFLEAIREIKVFSFNGIKSVIELLYDIGNYICELSYQNVALKGIVPEAPNVLPRVYDFYVDKLLEALLEVSFSFTEAERGSIMLFDESKEELYIKVSKGLKKEIIAKARSKVGEGIAGIIAQEGKPIFINEKIDDARIRNKLNNPSIRHSIGIPIKVRDKTWGVLNLGTSQDRPSKFTSESLETVDKLKQLVEATLGGISSFDQI